MASANLFYNWGALGSSGTMIEFLLIMAGSKAGTLAIFTGAYGAPCLVKVGNAN